MRGFTFLVFTRAFWPSDSIGSAVPLNVWQDSTFGYTSWPKLPTFYDRPGDLGKLDIRDRRRSPSLLCGRRTERHYQVTISAHCPSWASRRMGLWPLLGTRSSSSTTHAPHQQQFQRNEHFWACHWICPAEEQWLH